MRYADVILPLPLEGTFTYGVPQPLQEAVGVGMRVLVPLGKSKTYVALVARLHDAEPAFQVRDIWDVLDSQPVVLSSQLRLWQWVADYYLSPIGEVYNAALPAGLKASEGYRPKTEQWVSLGEPFRQRQAMHAALDMVRSARKQYALLTKFLELTRWDAALDGESSVAATDITREELLNEARCTPVVLKSLVDKHILYMYAREVSRLNKGGEPAPELAKPLNAAQTDAYNAVLFQLMRKNVVLLHGVTSSGKTEIYIHLIQKTIDAGQQVLYLLPEIALTVQMMERLQRVFGNRLGIYHSKYSDAERVEIWQKQLSAHPYDVILGARSACLLPFQRLGLVIVDEEHETSFKQQDPAPRYHARSVAIMLGAKVLLGSATPAAESYHNALTGKYGLVTLSQRYKNISLPEIQVVDTADLQRRKMMTGPFSPQLLAAVREALECGSQAILFQNRRGFAPMIECKACGWVPRCPNCDVSLTLHKHLNQLTCHYCGYTTSVPQQCPCCEDTNLRGRGFGTEKVEDAVAAIFPDARIARMDLDTARTRPAYERLIGDFAAGRTNLLIGTQMVGKGLDFAHVSVVGILSADAMLSYPDFRAYEHAFMMMAQVSGRAGRQGSRGRVILQTRHPDLPLIGQVVANDYAGFYHELMEERRAFRYPPFYRLVYVFLKHRNEQIAESAAYEMGSRLRELLPGRVLGPDKPAVARVKQLSIRKIVLKLENGIDRQKVRQCLRYAQQQLMADSRHAALQVYYDVDPL